MKERIIEFLQTHQQERFSIKALSEALELTSSEDYKELAKVMNALEEEARVIPNSKNKYTLIENTNYVRGFLDVKQKGFAFLKVDDLDVDDIYIPKHKLNGAMNKDHVLAFVEKSKRGLRKEGEVRKVLTRHTISIIGTVIFRGNKAFLMSDDKSIREEIIIPKNKLKDAKNYDKVQAKIINYAFKGILEVEVTQVIGNMNEAGVDILSKIFKHNVDPAFPENVLEEASKFKDIFANELENRDDYTDHMIITIDGETAKDFDDAIEVKKLDDETYYLGVHIADVSHYVQEDSLLDKEAYKRGTSIYLVDRVIPMLPENLSNNLCSLMPNVKRLAMSCEMEIDLKGKIKKHRIFQSIIESKARMTYTKVNSILEGDEALNKEYSFLKDMVTNMHALSKILYDKRTIDGSIHFETDEPFIKLDDKGKAIDVLLRERGESESIIEEFMLIANQVVAQHVYWMHLPFIYRIHEDPKEEKLEKLLAMASALGFDVKAKHEITHKELQKLLQKVENTASEKGMNLMMLRSMQKAIYSEQNLGHFGLAFEHYTHFTSPIRRYPDLIVHRLLRAYFLNKNQTTETIAHYEKRVLDIAKQSSTRERVAIELERDVLDMKKAEYMSRFIGESFEGTISSVTSFGIYVSLPNAIEGLVHITELDDDYYEFDEDVLILTGKKSKRIYRIGDVVNVKVTAVNIFDGEIDFKIK
ncbi:ribonuclease R [Liberiplasma polymorphum]|uniref:ribonuclease R n=1 Tax=Liberiplasma polymorphum TaxID=3374570 RepID=UPI003773D2E1